MSRTDTRNDEYISKNAGGDIVISVEDIMRKWCETRRDAKVAEQRYILAAELNNIRW